MTPDLLALLSKEQQEAWERSQWVKQGQLGYMWADDLPAALLELAQTKQELAELRAAVSRLAHEELCCYPNGPDEDTPCNCQLSRLPK